MDIKEFVKLFKIKIDELIDSDIIIPSKQDYDYNPGDWTFLFNCATYDIIKEHNEKKENKLSICIEPGANKTPKGRGGYSDILISSNDKKEKHIIIEHENFPKDRLKDVIIKLSKSKAKNKLLITYFYEKYSESKIIDEIENYVNKFFQEEEVLYLLIAPFNIGYGNEYKLIQICSKNLK